VVRIGAARPCTFHVLAAAAIAVIRVLEVPVVRGWRFYEDSEQIGAFAVFIGIMCGEPGSDRHPAVWHPRGLHQVSA